jgi:hypothetical protein
MPWFPRRLIRPQNGNTGFAATMAAAASTDAMFSVKLLQAPRPGPDPPAPRPDCPRAAVPRPPVDNLDPAAAALHLAASLGCADVVSLLLDQPAVDDSLLDANSRTCRELARDKDAIRAIEDSRSFLNATFRSQLHSYIQAPLITPPVTPPGLVERRGRRDGG